MYGIRFMNSGIGNTHHFAKATRTYPRVAETRHEIMHDNR